MKMTVIDFMNTIHAGKNKLQVGGIFAVYSNFIIADIEWDDEDGWAFYDFRNDFISEIDYFAYIDDDTELDVFQITEYKGD